MRRISLWILVAMLVASLCNLPSTASTEKPLGVIAQAEHAHLGSASAATGATVYAGDSFETEPGGVLRMRFGSTQFYLLASSAATLAQNSAGATLAVTRGTAGFSTPPAGQFALDTPAGIVHGASGKPAYGQVTITSPSEMTVSAMRGDLVLDNDGELHSIPEGKSYRVVIEDDPEGSSNDNKDFQPTVNHHRKRRIAFALILGGAVGAISYIIYDHLSESPSKP
ncbi:MAG: hypothetical protein ACRD5M_13130 [Candidatus Acidiferrales bacterium]